MKLGLLGFPQVGKRTLFQLLTGKRINGDGLREADLGLAHVRDRRFERLVQMYTPQRETPAYIEFVCLPNLDEQATRNATTFRALEQVDVICHLVRAFQNESVFHVKGNVDPRRDILLVNEELQLNDLLFIEKRLERLGKEERAKKDAQKAGAEATLLIRMRTHLEEGHFLRNFRLNGDEEKLITGYPLLTRKPMVIIVNIDEEQLGDPDFIDHFSEEFPDGHFRWIAVSAKIEQELSLLDGDDRKAFMDDLHIDHPALDKLTMLCYHTMGLVSFFTVGTDEVRSWTTRHGYCAPEAARVIHSDIQRGFIRAEVMKYEDLIALGGEQKVRQAGKFMLKGRDYMVEDGDIINFLFNV